MFIGFLIGIVIKFAFNVVLAASTLWAINILADTTIITISWSTSIAGGIILTMFRIMFKKTKK